MASSCCSTEACEWADPLLSSDGRLPSGRTGVASRSRAVLQLPLPARRTGRAGGGRSGTAATARSSATRRSTNARTLSTSARTALATRLPNRVNAPPDWTAASASCTCHLRRLPLAPPASPVARSTVPMAPAAACHQLVDHRLGRPQPRAGQLLQAVDAGGQLCCPTPRTPASAPGPAPCSAARGGTRCPPRWSAPCPASRGRCPTRPPPTPPGLASCPPRPPAGSRPAPTRPGPPAGRGSLVRHRLGGDELLDRLRASAGCRPAPRSAPARRPAAGRAGRPPRCGSGRCTSAGRRCAGAARGGTTRRTCRTRGTGCGRAAAASPAGRPARCRAGWSGRR